MSVSDASNLSGSVGILTKLAEFPQIWWDFETCRYSLNPSNFPDPLKMWENSTDLRNHHIRNNAFETSRENTYDVNMGCILSKETGGISIEMGDLDKGGGI
jgi:hypothetical protein